MSYALIVGPPGSGKSTTYMGDPETNVEGLPPQNTLVFVASEKPTHMRHSRTYTPIPLEEVIPTLKKGKPLDYNYIIFNSGNIKVTNILTIIEFAKLYGIKSRVDNKIYPLKNVIIDDFQDFINNIFYGDTSAKGYAKFDNVHTIPRQLLSYIKRIVNTQHRKGNVSEDKRVDFFLFMHVIATNPTMPVDDTNPLKWKLVGKVLENTFPLEGQFNNLILIDDFSFYGKPQPGASIIRSEPYAVEEGMPADLALLKQNFNKIYNTTLK